MACHKNNVVEVRALLTFSELDVNAVDHSGWTSLHEACFRGSTACVEELLAFSPLLGDIQRPVDTRAKGQEAFTPLMCAVVRDHTDICQLLLQHTGSVLLEDITDDNKTATDLATCEEVLTVLQHFKKHVVVTNRGRRKLHINSDKVLLVLQLCVTLTGAYLATHRTWDVYNAMKKTATKKGSLSLPSAQPSLDVEYVRYHRDFRTNLPKLRTALMKVKQVREYSRILEPLLFNMSLNKAV